MLVPVVQADDCVEPAGLVFPELHALQSDFISPSPDLYVLASHLVQVVSSGFARYFPAPQPEIIGYKIHLYQEI